MSWRTITAALTVIFVIVLVQSVLAGPLVDTIDGFQDSGTYDDDSPGDFDGEQRMEDIQDSWFDMGLVLIFGIMAWAVARVARRELTRNQQGGL